MRVKLTLSQKRKWSRNSIDHESSDTVKLEQLRDERCKPTVNRHAPLHKPNLDKRQRNAIKQSDVSQTTITLNVNLVKGLFLDNFDSQFSVSSMEFFFHFVHACGMMTYSDVLAATFESGTWISYDSKLVNLDNPLLPLISRSGRFDGGGDMDGQEKSSYGAACLDSRYRTREIQESGRGRHS